MIGPCAKDVIAEKNTGRKNFCSELSSSNRASESSQSAVRKMFHFKHNTLESVQERKPLEAGDSPARVEVVIVEGTWSEPNQDTANSEHSCTIDSRAKISKNETWYKRNHFNSKGQCSTFYEHCQNPLQEMIIETDSDSLSDNSLILINEDCSNNSAKENEDSNLLWLLDFRVDSLFKISEYVGHDHSYQGFQTDSSIMSAKGGDGDTVCYSRVFLSDSSNMQRSNPIPYTEGFSRAPVDHSPKKPPYTYTELIEHALKEKGELTVSGIYQWISERFPYYKANDDRWKNSVRHNLSINPYFKKGSKARHGSGHLWTLAYQEENVHDYWKKRRLDPLVLQPQPTLQENHQTAASWLEAFAESTLGFQLLDQDENKENEEVSMSSASAQVQGSNSQQSLEQSAGEILSGVKRDVEVQYITTGKNQHHATTSPLTQSDFLNPIPKDQVVEESGLLQDPLAVETPSLHTEITFTGLQESESIAADTLFGGDLNFQYYELCSAELNN